MILRVAIASAAMLTAVAINTRPVAAARGASALELSARAESTVKQLYTWTIEKTVEQDTIRSASASGTFNYRVTVTHDPGSSVWHTTGSVRLTNTGADVISGMRLAVEVESASDCSLESAQPLSVQAGSHADVAWACTYGAEPEEGVAVITASWGEGHQVSTTTALGFSHPTTTVVGDNIAVTDSSAGVLGTLSSSDQDETVYTYSTTLTATPGTCATLDTVTTATVSGSQPIVADPLSVRFCRSADLVVSATVGAAWQTALTMAADVAAVQPGAGAANVRYTVDLAQRAWAVSGVVSIRNPNDWQSLTGAVEIAAAGVNCEVDDANTVALKPGGSALATYHCEFTSPPQAAAGTLMATVTWHSDDDGSSRVHASASVEFQFLPLTVMASLDGRTTELGRVSAATAAQTFSFVRPLANAPAGACREYLGIATVLETATVASEQINLCNIAAAGHPLNFWRGQSGEALLLSVPVGLVGWLRGFHPFQDLVPSATPQQVAMYAAAVGAAADVSGAPMTARLKAQMLGAALIAYVTDPSLRSAAAPVGNPASRARIDITEASAAFGGATHLTVVELLMAQNRVATADGSAWYDNDPALQALAMRVFEALNNGAAPLVIR